jgi:protein TonB
MVFPAPPAAPVETPASVLSQTPLSYPIEAMRQGARGEVVIDVSIAIDGSVVDTTVEHSSGYRSLDAAAMRSIRHWRFNPARRDGQPVPTTLRIPIDFTPPVRG